MLEVICELTHNLDVFEIGSHYVTLADLELYINPDWPQIIEVCLPLPFNAVIEGMHHHI